MTSNRTNRECIDAAWRVPLDRLDDVRPVIPVGALTSLSPLEVSGACTVLPGAYRDSGLYTLLCHFVSYRESEVSDL